jgi:hypothetical protein
MWQGARVAQQGNYARNGLNEAGWVYTGWHPGTQNGNSGYHNQTTGTLGWARSNEARDPWRES